MMFLTGVFVAFLAVSHITPSSASGGSLFACPKGYWQRGSTCLSPVHYENVARDEAHIECLKGGGSLLSVPDAAKAKLVFEQIFNKRFVQVWTITKGNNDGEWLDDNNAPSTALWDTSLYGNGAPSTSNNSCTAFQGRTKRVITNHCVTDTNAYVCEADLLRKPGSHYSKCHRGFTLTSPGKCLRNVNKYLTFEDARAHCLKLGAYLATVTSLDDIRELIRYTRFQRDGVAWLRTDYVYLSPDPSNLQCHWLSYYYGRMRPVGCGATSYFVCETVPSRRYRSPKDALKCPKYYEATSVPGKCFRYIKTRETREQARRRCQQEGGNLASTSSWHQIEVLQSVLSQRRKDSSPIWLDVVYTNGRWISEARGSSYVNWRFGYPANSKANNCTSFYPTGETVDSHCFEKKAVMCEITTECGRGYVLNGGKCYRIFPVKKNKADAEALCSHVGARLLSVQNPRENNLVHQLTKSIRYGNAWLANPSNARLPYRGWGPHEPTSRQIASCMATFNNSEWQDTPCTEEHHVVCVKHLNDVLRTEYPVPDEGTWRRTTGQSYTSLSGYHCGKDWEMVNGKCYRLFSERKMYMGAKMDCKANYAELVVIDNTPQYRPLRTYILELIEHPTTVTFSRFEASFSWDGLQQHNNHNKTYICVKDRFCPDPLSEYNRDSLLKEYNSTTCIGYEHDKCDPTRKDCTLSRNIACARHNAEYVTQESAYSKYMNTQNIDKHRFFCKRTTPYINCSKEWQNREDGAQTATIDGRCLLNLNMRLTWQAAREACWSNGGYLTESLFKTTDTFFLIHKIYFKANSYWTGYYAKNGDNNFIGSESQRGGVDLKFKPGEPNGRGRENCLRVVGEQTANERCSQRFNAICEAPAIGFNDSRILNCRDGYMRLHADSTQCIKVFQESVTYNEANTNCQSQGAQLATIRSKEEGTFVKALSRGVPQLWISGCHRFVTSSEAFVEGDCSNSADPRYRAGYICGTFPEHMFHNANCKKLGVELTTANMVGLGKRTNFTDALSQCFALGYDLPLVGLHDQCLAAALHSANQAQVHGTQALSPFVWMQDMEQQPARMNLKGGITTKQSKFDFTVDVFPSYVICVKSDPARRITDFSFRTANKKRCMPGLRLRSLPGAPVQSQTTGTFQQAEMMCTNAQMSMPDRLSMHCVYDALQNLRRTYPYFAQDNYGVYLRNPNPLYMNANGGQISTGFTSKNKILCAEIIYSSVDCRKAGVFVLPPDGVGPRFTTNDFTRAQKMCSSSGRSLPVVGVHTACLQSFVNDALIVQNNGDYVSSNHGVWMEGQNGHLAFMLTNGVISKIGTPMNHVLCVKSAKTTYDAKGFSFRTKNENRCMPGLRLQSVPRTPLLSPTTGNFTEAEMMCENAHMSIPDRLSMHCVYDAIQDLRRTYSNFAHDNYGVYLRNPNPLYMNANGGQISTGFTSNNKILCADITYTSAECKTARVSVSLPHGVGPRFTTDSFIDAQKMCTNSGRSLPVVGVHDACLQSFVEDALKVTSNGDYVSATHGVWMEERKEWAAIMLTNGAIDRSLLGMSKNHVLCVQGV